MSEYIIAVGDSNFEQSVLQASNKQLVLVDFWATWCAPCLALVPHLEKFARDNAERIKVVKLDIDHNKMMCLKYNIRTVPSLILFKEKEILFQTSALGELEKFLKQYFSK
jgi:thioredoxin 1